MCKKVVYLLCYNDKFQPASLRFSKIKTFKKTLPMTKTSYKIYIIASLKSICLKISNKNKILTRYKQKHHNNITFKQVCRLLK